MKVLITGATGGLGRKLVSILKKAGHYDLVLLSRKKIEDQDDQDIVFRHGDLLDLKSLKNAVKDINIIIHLAAITHAQKDQDYFQINFEGTKNLLSAATIEDVDTFIFLSSRTASPKGGAYAESKYMAEKQVEHYRNQWLILSPAEIYGTGPEEAIHKLIHQIKKHVIVPIPGRGRYTLCPVYVDDVIEAIIHSMELLHKNKKYLLAGPKEYAFIDLVDLVANSFNKKARKIPVPLCLIKQIAALFPSLLAKDQIPRLMVKKSSDISGARRDLNFHPISFEGGLKKVIAQDDSSGIFTGQLK